MGLRNGDKIISVDNIVVEDFSKIPAQIILDRAKSIQVERDGKHINVNIAPEFIGKIIKNKSPDFIKPRFPFEIGGFPKKSAAKDAGLKVDDKIIGLNGKWINYYDEFRDEIVKYKNKTIKFQF